MSKQHVTLTISLIAVVALVFLLGLPKQVPCETQKEDQSYDVIFTIPIGDSGLHYAGLEPERYPTGPSSFHIASDGTFWIADDPANRLVQFDRQGHSIDTVEMPDELIAITDFTIADDGTFVVLDTAANESAVYRLSSSGNIIDRWTFITSTAGIMDVRTDGSQIIFEDEGGLSEVTPQKGLKSATLTKVKEAEQPKIIRNQGNSFSIVYGRKRRTETVANSLGGAKLIDSAVANVVPVLVEEMTSHPELEVDQTLWLYDRSLRPLGRARVPLAKQFIIPSSPVEVASDGSAYALLTAPDHVSIVKLHFFKSLHPILSPPQNEVVLEYPGSRLKSCIRRSDIIRNADEYLNNRVNLSTANLENGTCSGRQKPAYLTTPKQYTSVPYNWGGFDSVGGFNSAMASQTNNKAGNTNERILNCSRGVDCSGFVLRTWGRSTRGGINTANLDTICANLSSANVLKVGDVMVKVGTPGHVRLFKQAASDGAYWYEAIADGRTDRVAYKKYNWSQLTGYRPLRYREVCAGQTE
jgi:hypothetical protein